MRRRRLSVRLDQVAIATGAGGKNGLCSDLIAAAQIAERAGADQITLHLREDLQHVRERDARLLKEVLESPLDLTLAATAEMVKVAYEIKPDHVTLVPEQAHDRAGESGLDVLHQRDPIKRCVQGLREADIAVALCIEPDLEHVRAAHRLDARGVELHTGRYAAARTEMEQRAELQRLADAARTASKLGLRVAAGGGLHYHGIEALVLIEEIAQYQVGRAILGRAVLLGMDAAVRDMLRLLRA